MPWETTNVIEQRIQLIVEYLAKVATMVDLCARYGVSRKTAYKWVEKYRKKGLAGTADGSRKPRGGRHWMKAAVREQIVQMRREHPRWGAPKILDRLRKLHPRRSWPAASTAHDALRAEGLVKKRKRGPRRENGGSKCVEPKRANEIWAVDFKGQFRTGDGKYCYPLTMSDGYSRYLLTCEGLSSTEFASSWVVFEAALREYGLPDAIHSDNGEPFASKSLGGLSRLSVRLIRLGIRIERSRPGHPQDNGRHERMHRTLKDETTHPVGTNMMEQQEQFDAFRAEYNLERPHQALAGRTPGALYRRSLRPYPDVLPEIAYPSSFTIRRVRSCGDIRWRGRRLFVSEVLVGERLGLVKDEQAWLVYFGPVLLGRIDERKRRIVPTDTMRTSRRRDVRQQKPAPSKLSGSATKRRPRVAAQHQPPRSENRAMESAGAWKARQKAAAFPHPLENAPQPPPAFPTATTAPAASDPRKNRRIRSPGSPNPSSR
jgi:putative transposase